jgi:hypothetical protein
LKFITQPNSHRRGRHTGDKQKWILARSGWGQLSRKTTSPTCSRTRIESPSETPGTNFKSLPWHHARQSTAGVSNGLGNALAFPPRCMILKPARELCEQGVMHATRPLHYRWGLGNLDSIEILRLTKSLTEAMALTFGHCLT